MWNIDASMVNEVVRTQFSDPSESSVIVLTDDGEVAAISRGDYEFDQRTRLGMYRLLLDRSGVRRILGGARIEHQKYLTRRQMRRVLRSLNRARVVRKARMEMARQWRKRQEGCGI